MQGVELRYSHRLSWMLKLCKSSQAIEQIHESKHKHAASGQEQPET